MILEATAEGSTDIIKVADAETKLVDWGETKEVTESNAAEPESKVKLLWVVTAQAYILR